MERVNEKLYGILNESLRSVDEKIEGDFYEVFLGYPEKSEERKKLKGEDDIKYIALINVFEAAYWILDDVVYGNEEYLEKRLIFRFEKLKNAIAQLKKLTTEGVISKEESETIKTILLKAFDKNRLIEKAEVVNADIAKRISHEKGLENDHSIFNRYYWALKEITEEIYNK